MEDRKFCPLLKDKHKPLYFVETTYTFIINSGTISILLKSVFLTDFINIHVL